MTWLVNYKFYFMVLMESVNIITTKALNISRIALSVSRQIKPSLTINFIRWFLNDLFFSQKDKELMNLPSRIIASISACSGVLSLLNWINAYLAICINRINSWTWKTLFWFKYYSWRFSNWYLCIFLGNYFWIICPWSWIF